MEITPYISFAEKMAKLFPNKRGIDTDEFISAAYLGLVEATTSFNPELATIKTHIYHKVKGRLFNCARQNKDHGLTGKMREDYSFKASHTEFNESSFLSNRNVEQEIYQKEMICFIQSYLSKTECDCIILYYLQGKNQKEIGMQLNLSHGRISQIQKKGIKKLKKRLSC